MSVRARAKNLCENESENERKNFENAAVILSPAFRRINSVEEQTAAFQA